MTTCDCQGCGAPLSRSQDHCAYCQREAPGVIERKQRTEQYVYEASIRLQDMKIRMLLDAKPLTFFKETV